jgi:hypothetical protein
VCAAFARACLTLAAFGMCHNCRLFQVFQCVPTGVDVIIASLI